LIPQQHVNGYFEGNKRCQIKFNSLSKHLFSSLQDLPFELDRESKALILKKQISWKKNIPEATKQVWSLKHDFIFYVYVIQPCSVNHGIL
jgi:hypothetical protein